MKALRTNTRIRVRRRTRHKNGGLCGSRAGTRDTACSHRGERGSEGSDRCAEVSLLVVRVKKVRDRAYADPGPFLRICLCHN